MNYFLVRCTDILMFIVSILVEDINWLRGYLRTLTNTECVLFFVMLIVYTLLMKYLIVLLNFAFKFAFKVIVLNLKEAKEAKAEQEPKRNKFQLVDLISTGRVQKLNDKLNDNDPNYCQGYDEGYDKGYKSGKAKKEKEEADAARSAALKEANKSVWDIILEDVGKLWRKLWE